MACRTMCGCANPVGMLNRTKPKTMISCQTNVYRFSAIASNPKQSFTAEKEGYYLVILSATGGNINTVFNRGLGVEHCLVYLTAGQSVEFSLGSDSVFKLPDGRVLKATRNTNSMLEPKIAFQYLGLVNTKGRVVDTFGGGYNYPNRLDSVAGYHIKGIVPLASDINYLNTGSNAFMYWAKAKVNFPETGEYTFGAIGDDYANLYLDGIPVLLYSNIPSRDLRDTKISTGGTRKVKVSKGIHDVFLWNLSDKPSNIHSGMFINTATGQKVAASDESTNWGYVRSFTDCFKDEPQNVLSVAPNAPFPLSDTTGTTTDATIKLDNDVIEWITKTYPIPCATVTYEVKKINGVETSETRNTKNVTSTDRNEEVTTSISSRYNQVTTITWKDWKVNGSIVCSEKINETTKRVRKSSTGSSDDSWYDSGHNANDPDKSNNS